MRDIDIYGAPPAVTPLFECSNCNAVWSVATYRLNNEGLLAPSLCPYCAVPCRWATLYAAKLKEEMKL